MKAYKIKHEYLGYLSSFDLMRITLAAQGGIQWQEKSSAEQVADALNRFYQIVLFQVVEV